MTTTDELPMSESAFYILLALLHPLHGYGVIQHVAAITADRVQLGAGTVYGTLKKLQREGLIALVATDGDRKVYQATAAGRALLTAERARLQELVRNAEVLDNAQD
ncbi:PadR family transcriptional regulator [Lacticaseibacillus daqingensis]|uniref:PadR family transcriptional regulator n=1 Tax=Lacticaseibacillus daqingensis TaxID=2486014 RepID=UPI000F788ABD|nr:helix-turn-helix transcriptional regulator [Lacticaseibacillus daqingensis]